MQTFLPYASFEESAKVLDYRRLGKQRVETLQLLKALTDPNAKGWRNHPAAKQWEGHEFWLCGYNIAICDEWIARGYKDTCREKTLVYATRFLLESRYSDIKPPWLGDKEFHLSHRSNLLRKDPLHYAQYFGNIPNDLPYKWPSKEG